jgi:hypothetical protein
MTTARQPDVDLTDAEINNICKPLKQNAAKVRHLEGMHLIVHQAPDGRPLVNRSHYDAVTSGSDRKNPANEPKWRKKA